MQIVEVTELFIKDIFEWRNDKISRAMSSSSEKIKFESHLYWFKNIMNDKNQFVYIGIEEEKRIGICRFNLDQKNKIAEVSINLNPKMRGKNYGFQLLRLSREKFFEKQKIDLIAKIKETNEPSKKLFSKAGFFIHDKEENFLYYKYLKG
jgi:RimJ/RimL family protein N-acetyltransferase